MLGLSRSLSARLLGIFLLTALLAVIILVSLFSRGLGAQWRRSIEPHLGQYVNYIREDLGSPPSEERARELARRLPIAIQVERGGERVFSTQGRDLEVDQLRFRPRHRSRPGVELPVANTRKPQPGGRHQIAFNDDTHRPVLRFQQQDFTVYIEFERPRGRGRGRDELLWAVAAIALLLGLCYLGIRHQLAPIQRLQMAVQRMSGGDLGTRANEPGQDDLAQLANSIDAMAARLQQMLDAKRELLLSISHELRSPLTRARVASELLPESTNRQRLIDDIDAMEHLIERLVESERLAEHSVLNRRNLDLVALIDDVIAALDTLDTPVQWSPPDTPIRLWADEARLTVLVRNLLDNAVRHGRPDEHTGARIQVRLEDRGASVRLEVCDAGPGIDPAYRAAVTDAFYRPDASRTRRTGGFGLGLYLCQRIVVAHGGTLEIGSPGLDGQGTRVSLTLPRVEHT